MPGLTWRYAERNDSHAAIFLEIARGFTAAAECRHDVEMKANNRRSAEHVHTIQHRPYAHRQRQSRRPNGTITAETTRNAESSVDRAGNVYDIERPHGAA